MARHEPDRRPLIGGIIASGRDISALVAMESQVQAQTEQLAHAATHDPLTGLVNRSAFIDACAAQIAARRAATDPGDVVVLFCDLDRFKAVNDTHGHDVGDRVLEVVAARLQTCVRAVDVVGRYGGDEFTVLLGDGVAVDGDVAGGTGASASTSRSRSMASTPTSA
ncbi:MAG: GGDEF domain-containing protein [Acidimicrobiales bacterium]